MDRLLTDIADGMIRFEDAVTQLADAGHEAGIATLIAPRLALRSDFVTQLLGGGAEQPIALVCRAAGLSPNGYSAILRMRRRKRPDHNVAASVLLAAYREVPRLAPVELPKQLAAIAASSS
jgi:hypothetical protein